ncbi:hypothetical protein PF008_g28915 [Phytophthora fragariae]|uniref:Uncharacterized protein n=1 Tax=Phytophthora fragariae TaxID=53985 RepID=A0A6G0QAR6_9STRA|nr:hypothetical protein PF008_g28915 [Phytophthora fragariae]
MQVALASALLLHKSSELVCGAGRGATGTNLTPRWPEPRAPCVCSTGKGDHSW